MNDMHPIEQPEVELYFSLLEQRAALVSGLDQPDTMHPELLGKALGAADEQLGLLEDNDVVKAYFISLASPVVKELDELNQLQTFVESGLLSPEDVAGPRNTINERIHTDPRLKLALEKTNFKLFAETVTVVSDDVADFDVAQTPVDALVIQPSAPTEKEVSGEVQKPSIKITIRDNAVLIGKNGRYYKLSDARYSGQRDYATERLAVLRKLVERQGESLTVSELWESAFGSDVAFDRQVMSQIRQWLSKLTFRRQPIVGHNGKRGPSSAYGINNFNIQIVSETVTRGNLAATVVEEFVQKPDIAHKQAEIEEVIPPEVILRQEQTTATPFPLSLYESSLIASFLDVNRAVLEHDGVNPLDKSVVTQLQDKVSKRDAQKTKAREDCATTKELRSNALNKLREFFDDDDLVIEAVDAMSPKDDRYKLFSYLFELEGDDRWLLLQSLVDAQHELAATVDTSKFGGRVVTEAHRSTTYSNANGTKTVGAPDKQDVFKPTTAQEEPSAATLLPQSATIAEHTSTDQPENADKAPVTPVETQVEEKQPLAPVERKKPKWEADFTVNVLDAISQLAKQGLMGSDVMTAHEASKHSTSKIFGTITMIERMASHGLVKTTGLRRNAYGKVELDVYQRVTGWLVNTSGPIFGNRTRAKRAEQIIRDAVDEYLAEINRQKYGR